MLIKFLETAVLGGGNSLPGVGRGGKNPQGRERHEKSGGRGGVGQARRKRRNRRILEISETLPVFFFWQQKGPFSNTGKDRERRTEGGKGGRKGKVRGEARKGKKRVGIQNGEIQPRDKDFTTDLAGYEGWKKENNRANNTENLEGRGKKRKCCHEIGKERGQSL